MRVVFILDPSINQENIKKLLDESYGYSINYYDAGDNYYLLHEIKPNLVFISTSINGQSAFALIDKIKSLDFELVIVSSNEKSALKAFRYGAIHYIVTPVSRIDITRLKERLVHKKSSYLID